MARVAARIIHDATAICKALSGTLFKMSSEHACTLLPSSAVNEEERASIRSLHDANMSTLLDSSSSAAHGNDYFFHSDAVYLTVKHDADLIAFAMFKIEWDDLDVPEFPVLYLYELQVASSWRNQGIGSMLISTLEIVMRDHLRGMIDKMVMNLDL